MSIFRVPPSRLTASSYYWEYCKKFGEECYRTWRAEIVTGLAIACVTYLISWSDKTAAESALVAAEASLIVFSGFVIAHLFRTPFLLHREHMQPMSESQRPLHWGFGIIGIGMVFVLMALVSYRIARPWMFPLQNITINAPPPPADPRPLNPTGTEAPRGKPSSKPTQQAAPQSPTAQTVTNQPSTQPAVQPPAQTNRGAVPQTQLERLIQTNRNLPKGDRDRLAEAFFDYASFLDRGSALYYKANSAGTQIQHGWQDRSIAKDFDTHIKNLRGIDASAWAYSKEFGQIRDKWKYYPDQTDYIFGDNPDNLGPNSLINALEGFANYLERWGKISNKDQQDVLNLIADEQNAFNDFLLHFMHWIQGCGPRLEQMKKSIQ